MFKDSPANLVLKVTLIALCANVGLSYSIWGWSDMVPQFPIISGLGLSDLLSNILFIAVLGSAVYAFFKPGKTIVLSLVLLCAIAAICDWNKAQPYFFHYFLFLVIWLLQKNKQSLKPYIIAISGIYIWSGIHKLNIHYYDSVIPYLHESFDEGWIKSTSIFVSELIPYAEIVLGIILLIPRFVKVATYVSLAMHLGILVFLYQIGYNYAVWPWNLAFVGFHLVSLKVHSKQAWSFSPANIVAATLFMIFPMVNLFTHNFAYISWNLYSGRIPYGVVYFSSAQVDELPEDMQQYLWEKDGHHQLDLTFVSLEETHVAINPEPWIYRQWFEHYCDEYGDRMNVQFGLHLFEFKDLKHEFTACEPSE